MPGNHTIAKLMIVTLCWVSTFHILKPLTLYQLDNPVPILPVELLRSKTHALERQRSEGLTTLLQSLSVWVTALSLLLSITALPETPA